MVPIIAIGNGISFLVCLALTIKLWKALSTQKENKFLQNFTYSFSFLSLYFLILTLPDLLYFLGIKNILFLSAIQITAPIPAAFVIIFQFKVILGIIGKEKLEKIVMSILILYLVFSCFSIVLFFENSKLITHGSFFHLTPFSKKPWLRAKDGIFLLCTLLFLIFFFLRQAVSTKDKFVKKRSYFIGIGFLLLLGAAILNYIAGSSPTLPPLILASGLASLGMIFIFSGVVTKKKE